MALNKLRQLDSKSCGVTIPKDDLRVDGLLDDEGQLEGDHHVYIRHVEEGTWELEIVEGIEA